MSLEDDSIIEFLIEHDESMRSISLTVASSEALTPTEFLQCLDSLVVDHADDPDGLFEISTAICHQ